MTAAERRAKAMRYRREWLLTFSPGEWIWVIVILAFFAGLLLG